MSIPFAFSKTVINKLMLFKREVMIYLEYDFYVHSLSIGT